MTILTKKCYERIAAKLLFDIDFKEQIIMDNKKEKIFEILDEPNYLISMQDSAFIITNQLKLFVLYKDNKQEINITVLQYARFMKETNKYSFIKGFTKETKKEFVDKIKEILND